MLTDGGQTGKRCSVTRTRSMRNVQFKPMVEFHYVKIRKARYVLPVEKMRWLKEALTCEFADCRPRADSAMGHDLSDDEAEAAKLLAEADEELREQRTEEQMNVYTSVDKLRDFVKTESPTENVNVSVVMCVLSSERLVNNKGTRLTLVDGCMHAHMKAYGLKLAKMDQARSDAHVFKLTIWDPRNRATGKPRFQINGVYEFKKVHSIQFYRNRLQGSVQSMGASNPGLIQEFPDFSSAKRARLDDGTQDGDMNEDDE